MTGVVSDELLRDRRLRAVLGKDLTRLPAPGRRKSCQAIVHHAFDSYDFMR